MTKTINFYLLLLLALFVVHSCKQELPKTEFVFDPQTAEYEVISMYADSTPQVVTYYKVDEKGYKTNEIIGEAFFYENKQEHTKGALKNGKREGLWYSYFRDGSVQSEIFYADGKYHDTYKVYRAKDLLWFEGHYNMGICDGTWHYYDEQGNETRTVKADKHTIVCEYCGKCAGIKSKK